MHGAMNWAKRTKSKPLLSYVITSYSIHYTKLYDEGKKPLLVAADVQRPAAIEQLKILGQQIGVPVHHQHGGDPVEICKQALEIAKLQGADTIILDTAGRLHVDDALMDELERIVKKTKPAEIIFTCDSRNNFV